MYNHLLDLRVKMAEEVTSVCMAHRGIAGRHGADEAAPWLRLAAVGAWEFEPKPQRPAVLTREGVSARCHRLLQSGSPRHDTLNRSAQALLSLYGRMIGRGKGACAVPPRPALRRGG